MRSSRLSRLSPFLFALSAVTAGAASFTGCAGQGDVDRTQPDKVAKSIFFDKTTNQPKKFYYRETLVGVPPTTNWSFEGMQGTLQKIRFEITEKYLIGYRAYDYVLGSQNAYTTGDNNTDTPLVMYAITSHFDVKREYNPATGEQTNVISENTTDRPWDQREFMRVAWANNLVLTDDPLGPPSDPLQMFFQTARLPLDWYVSETDTQNPEYADRPIIRDDLIDFVAREVRTPDILACNSFWDSVFDDNGPWNCGELEIKARHSFMAVKPTTYEPLEYPDNYPLLDNNGEPIPLVAGQPCSGQTLSSYGGLYSGADCSAASVPGFAKFGFFRTIRQSYDRKYGATELGRKYYANRWNIWKDSYVRDDKGNQTMKADGTPQTIAMDQREPRPLTYYTNVEFPDDPDLFHQAQEVTNDWSKALKQTVGALRATAVNTIATPDQIAAKAADVPDMVILKKNSCNLTDFKAYLAQNTDVASKVEDAVGQSADELDTAHLTHACSVAEAATDSLADGNAKKFTWQRVGDLRYSFFHWVDRPQPGGPLGYGPSSADPETGEIVSASLFNYGAALDTYAQTSADTVELLNNQITVDDILSGKTIADVLKDTANARHERQAQPLTAEAKSAALAVLQRGATSGTTPQLIPIPTGAGSSKIESIKGTSLERELLTTDILAAMLPNIRPEDTSSLTQDQLNQASPVNWLSDKARTARRNRFQTLATNGCIYMSEFADDAIIGLALKLKQQGLSGDALFKQLRVLIFRGLADHEMGHTMGLRHNFAGSSDALNYGDNFWSIRNNNPQDQWENMSLSEYQYSTVMDYGSRFNSDVNGLGKYDMAAIRFGYGQMVDVMPDGARSGGPDLQNRVFLSDYSTLPAAVGGPALLMDGGVARYASVTEPQRQQLLDPKNQSLDFTAANRERPYKFCSDEFVGNLDCKAWDFGANQQEIVSDTIDRYKNYYFFIAFKRGRLNWSLDGYINRLLERYYARYTEAFQFYYYYGGYLASLAANPGITSRYSVDLGDDLLKASMDSLNALGEVMQTPEPGQHCATTVSPNVMVLPDASGPNACISGAPFMNIQIPDGKPYFINFSDDYYFRITRAGSLYEKLAALISLTSTEARFFRVDNFADSNNYSINYYRIFKDQMLDLLGGVIRNDPSVYGGYASTTGYKATPVVDPTTFGKVSFALPPYMQAGAKRVDTPVNKTIRYYALALSLANLNSTWDSTLDIANYLAVSVKGSNDDRAYGGATTVHEFSHPQSGLIYRAPQFDQRLGTGVQLIDELNVIAGTPTDQDVRLPTKYGFYSDGQGIPNWYSAKYQMDQAQAAGDQNAYNNALNNFQAVDYLVGFRVDLLDDLRSFRTMFGY